MLTSQEHGLRLSFFRTLFGERKGYVCIAVGNKSESSFKQHFFEWPAQEAKAHSFIEFAREGNDVWFGVNLLTRPERAKEYCAENSVVWADLDEADPSEIEPPPQVVIESSPGHYQAIWRLDRDIDPYVAEDYSRRIAYGYAANGADRTGWDLTQLLRVPFTFNYKYDEKPLVMLKQVGETLIPANLFEGLAETPLPVEYQELDSSMPDLDAYGTHEEIITKHAVKLRATGFPRQFDYEPTAKDDWSGLLWKLIHTCLESGLSPEETFVVAASSSVNKYRRDNRPLRYLWRDVTKAESSRNKFSKLASASKLFEMPELVPGANYDKLPPSFIDDYKEWGEQSTDAVAQYHELSAYIMLSALLAANIRIDTNYGSMRPNLWGLILGDSTLTRKTTAMRMAVDIITTTDPDVLQATDASIEGLLGGLQSRPNRTSLFFRDEVTGFFESFQKKEYLAGMPEMLTALYDGGYFARKLRKELIVVQDPVFVFFGGGIRDKVHQVMHEGFVLSGFLPRFLIVSGDTDLSRVRRTGPPTQESMDLKQRCYLQVGGYFRDYVAYELMEFKDAERAITEALMPKMVSAVPDETAWELYGEIEMRMVTAASNSPNDAVMLPTFERMSRSLLKMATINAAIRQKAAPEITVSEEDVLRAAKYIQGWGTNTIEVLENLGTTVQQRMYERVLRLIDQNPAINRSDVMRYFGLNKYQMNEIEGTLEDRGQIRVERKGKGSAYIALS